MTDAERRVVAEEAARAGAAVASKGFRGDLAVERKAGKTDVVTQADRDAQRRVVEVLRESFPDDPIVGEEEDALKTVPETGPAWVVDPIDGTNNFVRDVPVWATAVAAVVDAEPVAAAVVMPELDDVVVAGSDGVTHNGDPCTVSDRDDPEEFTVAPTYWWEMDDRAAYARVAEGIVTRFGDLRRFGSAQATLAMTAYGALEGVVTDLEMQPWDSIAGVHLVRQAGGEVTDPEGTRWRHDSEGIAVSNGTRHEMVRGAARDV